MIKLAFVLSGQPRNYIKGYNDIKEFLSNQEDIQVDFFYHCWIIDKNEKICYFNT
jgi:hypothetical protein